MEKSNDYLNRLSLLTGTGFFISKNDMVEACGKNSGMNPIAFSENLRGKLLNMADAGNAPVLYQDGYQILWGCVKQKERYIFIGPMSMKNLTRLELHHYYRDYGIHTGTEKTLPVFTLSQALAAVQMASVESPVITCSQETLIRDNHLAQGLQDGVEEEILRFQIEEDTAGIYHHTYQEERHLLACVREGRAEDALKYNMVIDEGTGRLSKREVNHWKKVVIVAITLCTRAAIEGGVSPAAAYQLSDFYIQKCDEYDNVPALVECRNHAVKQLTEQVKKRNEGRGSSNYVDQCKDYISKHYKEKIYLNDLADALGLSSTYLSRLFSKETGMRLQDYINWFKVERAANLLAYSEESIAHIGEYVNFPTQSYFGKIFKEYKHMTPKEYRNYYKSTEFASENLRKTSGNVSEKEARKKRNDSKIRTKTAKY